MLSWCFNALTVFYYDCASPNLGCLRSDVRLLGRRMVGYSGIRAGRLRPLW